MISINAYCLSRGNEGHGEDNGEEPKEGAVVVSSCRPRGRPHGSKNHPYRPIFVTQDNPDSLHSHVMEIASGTDIAKSLAHFARTHQRGVCVLSGTGFVTNVTLRQPLGPTTELALRGRFEVLSLIGTFLPDPALLGSTGLKMYLAGDQGEVVGGSVVGSLIAVGPIMIIAATFGNATYEKLPIEDDDEVIGSAGQKVSDTAQRSPLSVESTQQLPPMPDPSSLAAYNSVQNLLPPNGMRLNQDAYVWAHAQPPY